MSTMLASAVCAALAVAACVTFADVKATPSGDAGTDVSQTLIGLEKQSWVAWKSHDGAFFASFLSDDHVEVGARGITDKKNVVAGVASPVCTVEDYAVDQFKVARLSADTALLTYHARQTTQCAKVAVPSPVWVSSLYVRRDGRWVNVLFQQTPTDR